MTDLRPEELHVLENGQELRIASLTPGHREPLTVGVVFDVSNSRRGDRAWGEELDRLSEAVHKIWRQGDLGFVFAFDEEPYLLTDLTADLSKIDQGFKALAAQRPSRGTALYDAIYTICTAKPATRSGRKVLLVVSDFDDNLSLHTRANVIEAAQQSRTSIYSILLGGDFTSSGSRRHPSEGSPYAKHLSKETGGILVEWNSKRDLASLPEQVERADRGTYTLKFVPNRQTVDGKPRKVEIKTTRKGTRVFSPTAYSLPKV